MHRVRSHRQVFFETVERWISRLFNPPLVAVGTFLLIALAVGDPWPESLILAGTGALFAGVLPTGYVGWLVWQGRVEGFFVRDLRARRVPLLVGTFSCLVGVAVLTELRSHPAYIALMASYAVQGAVVCLLSTWKKVSLHAAGVWGPTAALVWLFGASGGLLLPVALGVCWARRAEQAHSVAEIVLGASTATLLTFLTFWLIPGTGRIG